MITSVHSRGGGGGGKEEERIVHINGSANPSNYRIIKFIYFHVCCDFDARHCRIIALSSGDNVERRIKAAKIKREIIKCEGERDGGEKALAVFILFGLALASAAPCGSYAASEITTKTFN